MGRGGRGRRQRRKRHNDTWNLRLPPLLDPQTQPHDSVHPDDDDRTTHRKRSRTNVHSQIMVECWWDWQTTNHRSNTASSSSNNNNSTIIDKDDDQSTTALLQQWESYLPRRPSPHSETTPTCTAIQAALWKALVRSVTTATTTTKTLDHCHKHTNNNNNNNDPTINTHYVVLAPVASGKTLAYGIPLILQHVTITTTTTPKRHSLILVPTRELVTQVAKELQRVIAKVHDETTKQLKLREDRSATATTRNDNNDHPIPTILQLSGGITSAYSHCSNYNN